MHSLDTEVFRIHLAFTVSCFSGKCFGEVVFGLTETISYQPQGKEYNQLTEDLKHEILNIIL